MEGTSVVKQVDVLNEPVHIVDRTGVVYVEPGRVVRTSVTVVNVEPVGRTSVVVRVATWEQVVAMVGEDSRRQSSLDSVPAFLYERKTVLCTSIAN